ncbi:MAG: beta-lactamase family protein [Acidobacteriota bacterium]|nr:beta-lactamase family protein [Acidobacteriota bacterium]
MLVFLAFAGNTFYGQTTVNDIEKQIDRLFSGYNHPTTPGVAVAVVRDGKIIFKKGYGAANLEHDVPITTKTVFQIASVSKQFTAFAIYLLEKQGRLSLEDDVRKHIPEIPDYGKTVRIKHLLSHTSGIKDQWALLSLAGWRMDDVITTPQILRLISRQKELNFEPGSKFLYSNSGYTLAAEIVRRTSGQTFAEFTRKNIFEPLRMSDTQFYDDYEKLVKNRAESYQLEKGVYKKKDLHNSADGASNLFTTVEDMAKWALNFENPVVGDAELLERFNAPSLLNNGERVVYAVSDGRTIHHAKGQNVSNYRGLNVLSHGGHAAGFRSTFWRFPDRRFAVVLLSNDEHFAQLNNAEAIIGLYLKDDLEPARTVNSPAAGQAKTVGKSNADLKDFEGRFYNDELETVYTAKTANGKLILTHIRHGDIELSEIGKDKFSGRIEFPLEVEFVRGGNGVVTEFRISNFGAKNVKFDKTGD